MNDAGKFISSLMIQSSKVGPKGLDFILLNNELRLSLNPMNKNTSTLFEDKE